MAQRHLPSKNECWTMYVVDLWDAQQTTTTTTTTCQPVFPSVFFPPVAKTCGEIPVRSWRSPPTLWPWSRSPARCRAAQARSLRRRVGSSLWGQDAPWNGEHAWNIDEDDDEHVIDIYRWSCSFISTIWDLWKWQWTIWISFYIHLWMICRSQLQLIHL